MKTSRSRPTTTAVRVQDRERVAPHKAWAVRAPASKPSLRELYSKRVYKLEQYKTDVEAGRYKNLTSELKRMLFVSAVLPIPVPLARGETEEMYENRFIQWLQKKDLTLAELESSSDDHLERFYRMRFAKYNVTGEEKFVPQQDRKRPSPERLSDRSPRKKNGSGNGEFGRVLQRIKNHIGQTVAAANSKSEDQSTRDTSRESDPPPSELTKTPSLTGVGGDTCSPDKISTPPSQVQAPWSSEPPSKTQESSVASAPVEGETKATVWSCSFTTQCAPDKISAMDTTVAHLDCGCNDCVLAAISHMEQKVVELEVRLTDSSEAKLGVRV